MDIKFVHAQKHVVVTETSTKNLIWSSLPKMDIFKNMLHCIRKQSNLNTGKQQFWYTLYNYNISISYCHCSNDSINTVKDEHSIFF